MNKHDHYIQKILKARVYDVAKETPLDEAKSLSKRLKNRVLLKREDLQPVHSFKIRGAYNKMVQLSEAERECGVIAASAGNHAQGLALAANHLKVKAIIVMPRTTPDIKVNSVRAFGGEWAEVVLHGEAFDQAKAHALELSGKFGYVFCAPFDDPDVIAGQGTVAPELLRQASSDIDAIFIPVGGGGLVAGVAVYIKYLYPEIKIIGVESSESACLKAAMEAGEPVTLDQVGIFADGVAVARIGDHTFDVSRDCVDEVITVDTDEICAAVKDIFDNTRAICEPSGALGVAGLKKYVQREECQDQTLIAINSGANMNFSRLRHVAERTDLGERKEALIAAQIPEQPGSFRSFCKALGDRNITEFNYRYNDPEQAMIFVGVTTDPSNGERARLIDELRAAGTPVEDLSDNEIAKLHIRYMVGGHSPTLASQPREVVYRFEFPERPGALMKFLNTLGGRWNISMFHYRNHGSDFGRILVGMQVPEEDDAQVVEFLDATGYPYWNETDNRAYQLFLG